MPLTIKAEEKDKRAGFSLVDETPAYLVIDKPAGLLVHKAPGKDEPTLADALASRYPELSGVGDDKHRPGIVHRLDKEASGLMVVARNQAMFENLKEQFKNRAINKEYLALAYGAIKHDHNVINRPIGRSLTKGGRMAAHSQNQAKDREAITEYWVERRFAHYTLLRIKPRTGRPHQIRVHLNSVGFPIVGDRLYTNLKARRSLIRHPLPRLFLHAAKLGFRDLEGEYREYESPLPAELENFLKTITPPSFLASLGMTNSNMPRSTNLVIISGPSGSGQDSVIEGLIKRGLPIERVVTTMARPMRPGESEGKPYYFVNKEKFDLMIQNNEMIEWAEAYDSKRGATKKELERVMAMKDKIVVWKMDWKGTAAAKKLFPEAAAIMITVPGIEHLMKHAAKRGDSPASIQARIEYSKEFLTHKNLYNYAVVNEEGKLEQTVDRVIDILKQEGYIS